jgi:hypothetical protein
VVLEILKSIAAELLIVKDVIQHWNIERSRYFVANVLPNFKYAILTHNFDPDTDANIDIWNGGCSPINLEIAPFNLSFKEMRDYTNPAGEDLKRIYLWVNPKTKN